MADPVRFVQVGAGQMGRTWLRALADSPDVQLVGLADLDVEAARLAAADTGHGGVAVGAELPRLLDTVPADAVLDVTVPDAHPAVSSAALAAGYPVLCEKPLAGTVAAGLSMVAAAQAADRLLMVSQSRRYFAQLSALRRQLARIGPVGMLECRLSRAPRFGGFREQMAFPLLVDMAIHQFDLARALFDDEPGAVYCASHNPAWSWYRGDAAATAVFEFRRGGRFTFTGSWCSPGLETSWNGVWSAAGPGGSARWSGDDPPQAEDAAGVSVVEPVRDEPEQIAGSLAEFVTALRTGVRPATEARRNVLSLLMVEAAVRSAQQQRRVELAEVLADAHTTALATESRPEIVAVLAGWGSAHDELTDPEVAA